MLTSSEVTNEAQAGAIDNWGAFKCFDHNSFPQFLFSSQLSWDSQLPRENHLVINFVITFLGDFQTKPLECAENTLTAPKLYGVQANQSE